jgi:indole-3-acetate monooxygenase
MTENRESSNFLCRTPVTTTETRNDPIASEWLRRAAAIAPTIAAQTAEIERRRELPAAVRQMLIEGGFFRLPLPRSLGGADPTGLPAGHREDRGRRRQHRLVPQPNERLRNDRGVSRTGSGAHGVRCAAWHPCLGTRPRRGAGRRRRLSGHRPFQLREGSHEASWLGAHLPIVDQDGSPRREPDGSPVVRTRLFPKSNARMTDIWHVIGLKGTGSDQYSVADLFVPEAFCIARRDGVGPRESELLYRFANLELYAVGFAGVAVGIARSMLDAFIELARDKIPRGARRTLRDNQMIQAQVAQAEAKLAAARASLLSALETTEKALVQQRQLGLDQRMTIRLAATFAIHQARDAANTAYHAAGATAIFAENPFERRFRDIHTVSQQLQGRQEHCETVGQYLLGLEPDSLAWL